MTKKGGSRHTARDAKGRFTGKRRVIKDMGLTSAAGESTMSLTLFEEQPDAGKDDSLIVRLLGPLTKGQPVVLAVRDRRMPKKKRITGEPLLFLTPAIVFGGSADKLVVSFQANGCEVIDLTQPLKSIAISRTGLSITLSAKLVEALNQVFNK